MYFKESTDLKTPSGEVVWSRLPLEEAERKIGVDSDVVEEDSVAIRGGEKKKSNEEYEEDG